MKRFVDLRGQEVGANFCWYDTVTDTFEVFGGKQTFQDWDDFQSSYVLNGVRDRRGLDRYKRLCPDWVKGELMATEIEKVKREEFEKQHPEIVKAFAEGDWVFGLGEHKGCSNVFWGAGVLQPFDYLEDYDPKNFRLATEEEKLAAWWTEPTEVEKAMKDLKQAMKNSLEFAWSWHCNIAMMARDAGATYKIANEGAARFMQLCFGVDTRKHPGFPEGN